MTACDRLRNFVFTLNNPSPEDLSKMNNLFFGSTAAFLIYGNEVSKTGTPHIQGYCELNKQMRFKTLRDLIPRCHIASRKGTALQAAGYCCKGTWEPPEGETPDYTQFYPTRHPSADVSEYGMLHRPGKRTDLDTLVDQITVEKLSRKRLAEENPQAFLKYPRGVDALYEAIETPRSADTGKVVKVYWGSTGTGKTRTAFEAYPDAYLWGPEMGKWFNGYDGHDVVIMDEFRGQLPLGFLNRLLDRYPMRVETKGGFRQMLASTIIITSPSPPHLWYTDTDQYDRTAQLFRRLSEVREFSNP